MSVVVGGFAYRFDNPYVRADSMCNRIPDNFEELIMKSNHGELPVVDPRQLASANVAWQTDHLPRYNYGFGN